MKETLNQIVLWEVTWGHLVAFALGVLVVSLFNLLGSSRRKSKRVY